VVWGSDHDSACVSAGKIAERRFVLRFGCPKIRHRKYSISETGSISRADCATLHGAVQFIRSLVTRQLEAPNAQNSVHFRETGYGDLNPGSGLGVGRIW
jgi:hypothetical protein